MKTKLNLECSEEDFEYTHSLADVYKSAIADVISALVERDIFLEVEIYDPVQNESETIA